MPETTEHGGGEPDQHALFRAKTAAQDAWFEGHEREYQVEAAVRAYLVAVSTPPTRGDAQAEVARLRERVSEEAFVLAQWSKGLRDSNGLTRVHPDNLAGMGQRLAEAALPPTSSAEPQAPDGGVVETAKAILRNTDRSPPGERAWVTVGDIRPLADAVVHLAQRPPSKINPEEAE